MRKCALGLLLLGAALAACDDGASQQEPAEEAAPAGNVSSSGGGGGQVSVQRNPQARGAIEERYEKALQSIKKREWDNAHDELTDALKRGQGHAMESDIRQQIKVAEQGLLAQPTYEAADLMQNSANFFGRRVSVRGTLVPGGKVGRASHYFWIRTARRKIQARYGKLSLDDKKTILLLKEGALVLGRGSLKEPWGTNPNPYLELSYFRLEKLSPERAAAQKKRRAGEQDAP
ncbi:MAG: hypothetical protein ABIJ96_15460 [Elusimicrobiota bacterium]